MRSSCVLMCGKHGQSSDLHAIKTAWGVAIFQGGMRDRHHFVWATEFDANHQFGGVWLSRRSPSRSKCSWGSQKVHCFFAWILIIHNDNFIGKWLLFRRKASAGTLCSWASQACRRCIQHIIATMDMLFACWCVLGFVSCWKGALSTSARMWAFGRGAGGQPKPSVPIGGIRSKIVNFSVLKWGIARFADCKSNRHDFNIEKTGKCNLFCFWQSENSAVCLLSNRRSCERWSMAACMSLLPSWRNQAWLSKCAPMPWEPTKYLKCFQMCSSDVFWYVFPPKGECLNEAATFTSGPSLVLLAEAAAIKVGKSNGENVKQFETTVMGCKFAVSKFQILRIRQHGPGRWALDCLQVLGFVSYPDLLVSVGSWKTYTLFVYCCLTLFVLFLWIEFSCFECWNKALTLEWYLTNNHKYLCNYKCITIDK